MTPFGLFLSAAVFAAPAPSATKPGGPPIVFQVQSVDQLLKTARAVTKTVAGDQIAGMMDEQIKQKLGEKGLSGLDTTKPIGGYVFLPDKVPTEPEDFKGFGGVAAIPITGEAEFKELLGRIAPDDPLKLIPLKDSPGLYAVESPAGEGEVPIRLRFVGKFAYLGVNVPDEAMAADKLLKTDGFIDPKETAVFAAKVFHDKYPKDWAENSMKQMEEAAQKLQQVGGPETAAWANLMLAYGRWTQKLSVRIHQEAKESGYKLKFDEPSGEVGLEMYTTPKPGTPLAAELAARKPTQNQFAGLLAKDAAASLALQIPMMDNDFRAVLTGVVEQGEKKIDEAPEEFRPLAKELYAGLRRTIQGESIDAITVLSGPDKKGHFSVLQCVTFADAKPIELALKAAAKKSSDAKFKDAFQFDVDKAGEVNLHRLVIPEEGGPGEGFKKVFGSAEVIVAFGPKGVYFGMGERAKEAVGAALATKPAKAYPFELSANPKRLGQLVSAIDENAGGMAKQFLGEDDKLTPAVYMGVDGGERMTFRFAVNLKLAVRPLVMATGVAR